MERNFYTDNFEQLLKEKSDEFRMYPSKRVWHSIYNDLHPGRKWPSVAVSLVLIIALLMVGYWNNKSNSVIIASADQKNIPAKSPASENTTELQSNTVASSTNAPTTQQAHGRLNNVATLSAQQNAIIAANNTNSKSPASLSAVNNNSLQQTGADHNQIIIVTATDNINAENGAAAYNNSQKPVAGSVDAGNNEKLNTGIAAALATLGNYSFAGGATAMSSPLQQNGTRAIASGAISSTPAVVKEDVALQIVGNNEEEIIITTPETAAISNAAKTELNNSNDPAANLNTGKKETTAVNKDSKSSTKSSVYKKITSTEDKEWIEDYAFHNKSRRKNWQDRTAFEFYITPSVGYSKLSSDAKYNLPVTAPSFVNGVTFSDANNAVSKRPALGFEAGFGINYSLSKKLVFKTGIQGNYTNYGINADETNHPTVTTLMLIDPNSGFMDLHPALTTLSNIRGSQPVVLHNKTYQVSLPLGFAYKLSGNNKLAWYTGATIQPTFVAGGKAYLISADRNNYVADASLIRKWNLNTGIETYITYKFDGFTLQGGPQLRYQLLSTYYDMYTVKEKLSNIGIKIGLIKNF